MPNKARKSFWMHPMELLGDVGLLESHFGLFGDSVSVGARLVHGLSRKYHRLRNHFGRYMEAEVEVRFGPFGNCVSVDPFGDSANLDARLVHGLRRTYHRLGNRFGRTVGTPW